MAPCWVPPLTESLAAWQVPQPPGAGVGVHVLEPLLLREVGHACGVGQARDSSGTRVGRGQGLPLLVQTQHLQARQLKGFLGPSPVFLPLLMLLSTGARDPDAYTVVSACCRHILCVCCASPAAIALSRWAHATLHTAVCRLRHTHVVILLGMLINNRCSCHLLRCPLPPTPAAHLLP
jgi:hypothetical protein